MESDWTVQVGKHQQTKVYVPTDQWPNYRAYLARERADGRVIGWTTIASGRNTIAIITHNATR